LPPLSRFSWARGWEEKNPENSRAEGNGRRKRNERPMTIEELSRRLRFIFHGEENSSSYMERYGFGRKRTVDKISSILSTENKMSDPQPRADVAKILGLPHNDLDSRYCGNRPTVSLDRYKEAVRMKIAELEGFRHCEVDETTDEMWGMSVLGHELVPDYPNDKNAMREVLIKLPKEKFQRWWLILCRDIVPIDDVSNAATATALQEAEALILTP
jgi:hypothetical protein